MVAEQRQRLERELKAMKVGISMKRIGKERFKSLVKGESYTENSHPVRNSSPQGRRFQSENSRATTQQPEHENDFVCCNKESTKWLEMQRGDGVPNPGKE